MNNKEIIKRLEEFFGKPYITTDKEYYKKYNVLDIEIVTYSTPSDERFSKRNWRLFRWKPSEDAFKSLWWTFKKNLDKDKEIEKVAVRGEPFISKDKFIKELEEYCLSEFKCQ